MFAPFLLWLLTFIFALSFFFILYIFIAYVFSRLGKKFAVGSFIEFLIPIYNVMLLCDCASVSRWLTVGIVAPGLISGAMNALTYFPFMPLFVPASGLIALIATFYLWGSIAKRLGKNFWVWGILTTLLMGAPLLILAFDNSTPYSSFANQNNSSNEDNKNSSSSNYSETVDI